MVPCSTNVTGGGLERCNAGKPVKDEPTYRKMDVHTFARMARFGLYVKYFQSSKEGGW
jgi:hypothetical protein